MDGRIRLGERAVIAEAIRPGASQGAEDLPDGLWLSFSNRVRNLPDEAEFATIMEELGITYEDHGPAHEMEPDPDGEGIRLNGNRMVEVRLPLDRLQIMKLGNAMVNLARQKGTLGNNDVLFLDHTDELLGMSLMDFYDLRAEKRERYKAGILADLGMPEDEIIKFLGRRRSLTEFLQDLLTLAGERSTVPDTP